MKRFLFVVVLPILVYIVGGWIAKDIYLSFVDKAMTLHDYYITEIRIYNTIAVIYCLLFDDAGCIAALIPFGLAILMMIIPMSAGAAVLNAIVCIIVMIYCTATAQ